MPGHARAATGRRLVILVLVVAASVTAGVLVYNAELTLPAGVEYGRWVTWAGLLLAIATVLSQWKKLIAIYGRRRAAVGAMAGAAVLAVGLFALATRPVNLAADIVALLESIEGPVEMIAFDTASNSSDERQALREYRGASRHVTVRFVDPDRDPAEAKAYDVQSYGSIVLRHDGRMKIASSSSEDDMRTALKDLLDRRPRTIQFTQGHGEKTLEPGTATGYGGLVEALRREGYDVSAAPPVDASGRALDPAAILAVAGPAQDFTPREIQYLRTHLTRGGRVILMLDPSTGAEQSPLVNLQAFAVEHGIRVGNDFVIDTSGVLAGSATFALAEEYPSGDILRVTGVTMYPNARSVTPAPSSPDGVTAHVLVRTGDRTWAETSLDSLLGGEAALDARDQAGPVSIAVARVTPGSGARLVVIGDSDFAADQFRPLTSNPDVFPQLVAWLRSEATERPASAAAGDNPRIIDHDRAAYYRAAVAILLGAVAFVLSKKRIAAPRTRNRAAGVA